MVEVVGGGGRGWWRLWAVFTWWRGIRNVSVQFCIDPFFAGGRGQICHSEHKTIWDDLR